MTNIGHHCFRFAGVVLLILGVILSIDYIHRIYKLHHVNGAAAVPQPHDLFHTQRQLKETNGISTDQLYPNQLGTPPIELSSKGYIVLEQLSNTGKEAILDLLIFQCWATKNKLQLIQPSISTTSNLVMTDLFQQAQESLVPLSSVYNMNGWDDVFLNAAVTMNKMIAMTEVAVYDSSSTVFIVDVGESYDDYNINQTRCIYDSEDYRSKIEKLQQFNVKKELCFNSNRPLHQILLKLSELIATEHGKNIIIIRNWPNKNDRELNGLSQFLQCGIVEYTTLLKHSQNNILEQATQYIQSQFNNDSYVAIVLTPGILKSRSFSGCLEQILKDIHELTEKDSKLKFFIALFESQTNSIAKLIPFKLFFRSIYWMSYSIDQWKKDINNYYSNGMDLEEKVQLLQTIASRASCLILAGQGKITAQIHTKYNQNLFSSNYGCLFTVTECNSLHAKDM